MHVVGSIVFKHPEMVICGHPAFAANRNRFPVKPDTDYQVSAEIDGDEATAILITSASKPVVGKKELVRNKVAIECHGGLMICDAERLEKALHEDEVEEFQDFFSDGLVSWESISFGTWKANILGGNLIFIPTSEYLTVYRTEDGAGYWITCRNPPE